jgi:hypothetical protein
MKFGPQCFKKLLKFLKKWLRKFFYIECGRGGGCVKKKSMKFHQNMERDVQRDGCRHEVWCEHPISHNNTYYVANNNLKKFKNRVKKKKKKH